MPKLPKGNLFCETCLVRHERLEDFGPDEELSDEDYGDGWCICDECGSLSSETTFEKKLAKIKRQMDALRREEQYWLNLQRKYESS